MWTMDACTYETGTSAVETWMAADGDISRGQGVLPVRVGGSRAVGT